MSPMASSITYSRYTPRRMALFLAACAASLLIGALGFQYLGGLAPCPLCIWQRYALVIAMVLSLGSALSMGNTARVVLAVAALAFLASVGVAAFHLGVEHGWWQGTQGCTGGQPMAATLDDLMKQVTGKPPPRCDQAAWSLFGISLAGYNLLASAALAILAGLRAAVPGRSEE